MKQIAVVGAGGMGLFHCRTIAAMPDAELAMVADPFLSGEARALGVPVSEDALAVAGQGWDGVIVASTDETHAELTLAAIKAGSRVLCEKPLSHDVAGAVAVVNAEALLDRRLVQVGFMRRFDPEHVRMAAEVDDVGTIQFVRCTHRNTNEVARSPRIVIVQSLIHDIHTITWLGGRASEVSAVAVPRAGGLAHVAITVKLSSGALATIEFHDDDYAYEVEVEVTGSKGMVRTDSPFLSAVRRFPDQLQGGTDWFGWFTGAYRIQDRAWVESLHQPEAIGPSVRDGLEAQLVAEAAVTSLDRDGRYVAIEHEHFGPGRVSP